MRRESARPADLFCSIDRTSFVAVSATVFAIFVFALMLADIQQPWDECASRAGSRVRRLRIHDVQQNMDDFIAANAENHTPLARRRVVEASVSPSQIQNAVVAPLVPQIHAHSSASTSFVSRCTGPRDFARFVVGSLFFPELLCFFKVDLLSRFDCTLECADHW
jgi:hypothetical protein